MTARGEIDWAALRQRADEAATHAYAPYSGLRVGAAALTADGRVLTACNVENASYGLTLCAECGLVSGLAASGGGRLVAVAVTAGDGRPLAPCGRCRQLLMEHGGPELLVDTGSGAEADGIPAAGGAGGGAPRPTTLGELLPGAFDRGELESRRPAQPPPDPPPERRSPT